MATLKAIDRSATLAFAPMAPIMAAGTMAGAIDSSFSSTASLEILELDLADARRDLPVIKSCPTAERFNRLSWGNNAVGSEEYALGIVAGSLADGSINLWNPAKLTSEDCAEPTDSVIARADKHKGAVRGLEFSVLSPNLLASGGDEGDMYIWDLKVPTQPTHYPALRGGGVGNAQGEISYISWNRKVQPIVASTSHSGTSVVWDLRKQKPVLSFADPSIRRRCSALQWNPENATQLVVSSDDDRSPALQVWDLRNSVSPLKEFVGHTKGVLAMAWCPIDSALLLSCGKDNLTLCWDTLSGEVLYELPASSNWNFDVQWSPRTPGVLSTSSFDGNIGIYNIEACSWQASSETSFGREIKGMGGAAAMKRAPKWMKRSAGVSFGFGGKLTTFGTRENGAPTAAEIRLHSLVTEEELVKQSSEFESAISGGEKPGLRDFCDAKAETAGSEEEKEAWSFLKVMFEDDARRKLLTHLNFEVAPTESDVQESEPNVEAVGEPVVEEERLEMPGPPEINAPQPPADEGDDDFFDGLKSPKTPPAQMLEDLTLNEKSTDDGEQIADLGSDEKSTEESDEPDEAVQRALVVGDFKAAVQHCLSAGRIEDALILAYVGGSTLWETTQNDYIQKAGRPYLKILSAVVSNDLSALVEKRPLKTWKETLALLCTYARSEDWTLLSDALAARLVAADETQAATLCYICSGNIQKAAEIWSRSLEKVSRRGNYVEALQALMEKVVVLSLATGQKRLGVSLSRLVKQYAELLVSQGLLATAQEYLSLLPADESSLELSVLQDRIYGSGVSDVQREPPSVPWESQPLQVDPRLSLSNPAQSIYPPPEDASTPSYYQGGTISSPATEPPQRSYMPTEDTYNTNRQSGVASGYSSSAVYPPQQPSSYSVPTAGPGGYYPSPANTFYPQKNSEGQQPFTPGVPSKQPFMPVAPSQPYASVPPQTFTPVVPSQGYSSAIPTPQTFTPVAPPQGYTSGVPTPQTFTPGIPSSQSFGRPQSVPAPPPQTFMPVSPRQQPLSVSDSGAGSTMQNPQLSTVSAPIAPPAPAATVQNADTSNVSGDLKPVVATLKKLFSETSEAVGGSRANPVKKREIDNNSRKLGALFVKLNTADLSPNASSKLLRLCQALDVGDYVTALQIQVDLTTSDWDECSGWLTALKQMIKARQHLG